MSSQGAERILVVGGGIIGASVAFQLSLQSRTCTVVEQCEPACAASGKSGGFLALDWCDDSELKHLARPSFQMHEEYSTTFGPIISYRKLESYSVSLVSAQSRTARNQRKGSVPDALGWINGGAQFAGSAHRIGTNKTNAQVHPKRLTNALLNKAKERAGTRVVIARVENITRSEKGWKVEMREGSGELSSDNFDIIVLSMGPWTIQAQKWFPSLPAVMAQKAASLVVKTKVPPTALFSEYMNSRAQMRNPEAYPREDEVYMCQSAIPEDLPENPLSIEISEQDRADLKEFGSGISHEIHESLQHEENVVGQACNLPISPDGLPIIGAIADTDDSVYVATGHSCWGILNSPATGKAIADMIVHGKSCIKTRAFCPSRFS